MGGFYKISLLMLFLLIFIPYILAQTPNYDVNIYLTKKSVEIEDIIPFLVDVTGGGFCEDTYFSINTEGEINFEKETPIIKIFLDQTPLEEIDLKNREAITCRDSNNERKEIINWNEILAESHIEIRLPTRFQQVGYYKMNFEGVLSPKKNNEDGEYDIIAKFECLNNGSWYNFNGKNSFTIRLEGEKEQFVSTRNISRLAVLIALVALFKDLIKDFFVYFSDLSLNTKTKIGNIFRVAWYKIKNLLKSKESKKPPTPE